MSMSNKSSPVWQFCTLIADKQQVKCNLCQKVFSFKCGAISNIRKHITTKHKTIDLSNNGDRFQRQQTEETRGNAKDLDKEQEIDIEIENTGKLS